MTKKIGKRKLILTSIMFVIICGLGVYAGFFMGNWITNKYLVVNKYENVTQEMLRDDISTINLKKTTPKDLDSAIVFQIAEMQLMNTNRYEVRGKTHVDTSAGVSQESSSLETRDGDNYYTAFTTYSSVVKTSRYFAFNEGGDVVVYEGTPTDASVENVEWSKKCEKYTWEGYYETFGKYANRNSNFIVSTKTVTEDKGVTKEGNLYKYSIVLDTNLSTIGYKKQIGNNAGINPTSVVFNKAEVVFFVDENFNFVRQEKTESYTVPYGAVKLTLDMVTIVDFQIK